MARRKKTSKRQSNGKRRRSSRPLWTGAINFALVNIPVTLHPAASSNGLEFHMLDKHNFAPIKYRRVNARSGREVPWSDIVKGYEYKKGEYVPLSDKDFENANVEASRSIDIVEFVEAREISPIYYDTPYYLLPAKNSQRPYILLNEAMRRTDRIGIATIVLRTRQHLCALLAGREGLILDLLRFQEELRDIGEIADGKSATAKNVVPARELNMATQLIESMAAHWQPRKYHDKFRGDLLKMIERKIKTGQTKAVDEETNVAPRAASGKGKVVDIMHLLRRSMEQARGKPQRQRKAG
jgi:DNA end-binding protein Ku